LLGEQLRSGLQILEEDKAERDEEEKEKEDADFIERMRKKAAEAKADAEYALKKIELEKNKNQFIAQGLVSTSNLIATVAGKDSKVGKAAATASAVISGIGAVQNAFKSAQDSPITTFFPPYPFVQAGIAAAFTAKQVQAINAVKPGGGGGSQSITSRGGGAPSINVVGASPINQLAETIGKKEQQPIKAFVVSDEVTNQQALDRKINLNASI
jgi:hypothetical protein